MSSYWPLFGLQVVAPSVELRYADDALLLQLADLAATGIHGPELMPFLTPWTDAEPGVRARSVLTWNWRSRAATSPEKWSLAFAVIHDGRVVGMQDLFAENFAELRQAETGSWLGQEFHGRGIGTAMRSAVLDLLFAGLGGESALTGAFDDNASSLGVTRKLGYQPNGEQLHKRGDGAARTLNFRMTREQWAASDRPRAEIIGLTDEVRTMLGAAA